MARTGVIFTLSAILLASVAVSAQAAAPLCLVTISINTPKSPLSLSGTLTAPVPADVLPVSVKAAGYLYAVLPTTAGKCPSSAKLATALKAGYVAAPKNAPGLTTVPANPKAVVNVTGLGPFANITVVGLEGAVAGNVRSDGSTVFRLTAQNGTAAIQSPLALPSQDLKGQTFSGSGCAVSASGSQVLFKCDKLSLKYNIKLEAGGQKVEGSLLLSGKLSAAGSVSKGKVVSASQAPANPKLLSSTLEKTSSGRRLLSA